MKHLRPIIACCTLAIAFTGFSPHASGQSVALDSATCLGFAFGSWTPPLDWKAAGHTSPIDSAHVGSAPGGKSWAANDATSQTPRLMLFPTWWPAGVSLQLVTRPRTSNDTVAGRATALVADGRLRAPTSAVRAWRIACGSTPSARTNTSSSASVVSIAADPMIGKWQGSSACVGKRAACRNESVVYYVSRDDSTTLGALSIDARKIVNGAEEAMGTLSCRRDPSTAIVACTIPLGTWRFLDHGRALEGAFTLNDGTQVRDVKARKVGS